MKKFSPGDRVVWSETGETAVVLKQFEDGFVSVQFERGQEELESDVLDLVEPDEK